MPLIVISGLPSSGKSTVAAALAEVCRQAGQEVVLVDEDSLHLQRNESYKDATSEKMARAALLSAVDRSLDRRRTVLLDTQNNIKGYRYQLWCIARTIGTRFSMVLVDTPPDTCRQWNDERHSTAAGAAGTGHPAGDALAFAPAIFADLACRFERPDSRNRWDSPLFTLRPLLLGPADLKEQLEAIAAAVAPPPSKQQQQQQQQQRRRDETAAAEATAAAAEDAAGGQPADSTEASGAETAVAAAAAAAAGEPPLYEPPSVLQAYRELKPHVATSTVGSTLSATNLQCEIDAALQHVLHCMAEAQAAAGSGAPGIVCFGPGPSGSASGGGGGSNARFSGNSSSSSNDGGSSMPPLDMYRPMFLPELRRHKRAFMKLATNQTFTRVRDAAAAQRMFLAYLRDQLAAAA